MKTLSYFIQIYLVFIQSLRVILATFVR